MDPGLHVVAAQVGRDGLEQGGVGRAFGAAQDPPQDVGVGRGQARLDGRQEFGPRHLVRLVAQAVPGGGRLLGLVRCRGRQQGRAAIGHVGQAPQGGDPQRELARAGSQLQVRHRQGVAQHAEGEAGFALHRQARVGQGLGQPRQDVVAPDQAGGPHGGQPHVGVGRREHGGQRVGGRQSCVLPAGDGLQVGGAIVVAGGAAGDGCRQDGAQGGGQPGPSGHHGLLGSGGTGLRCAG
jgi:hypothetical protein